MKEIWKDVPRFEGHYQISNMGNIKSLMREINNSRYGGGLIKERILKRRLRSGYAVMPLKINGNQKTFSIHRLVATAFIPNPENKPQVNHINGVRDDNRVENLEWCTGSENVKHSYNKLNRVPFPKGRFGKNSNASKKISQYDLNGLFIKSFDSQIEAAKITNTNHQCISLARNNKIKTAGGFIWK